MAKGFKKDGKFRPIGNNKKTATLGLAFGRLEQVDPNDIPITPPPNAQKCKKCGGGLALFSNRSECRKCKDVVKF